MLIAFKFCRIYNKNHKICELSNDCGEIVILKGLGKRKEVCLGIRKRKEILGYELFRR